MQSLIPELHHCIFLAGPTASGKSALAILLAQALTGEIISVDSMQVYRGLNIGSAKPSLKEQDIVPHHLIDILSLNEPFDASQFVHRATEAIRSIIRRNRIPILVGGTGLYFKALLFGLGETPPSDAGLRQTLESIPFNELLDELCQKDPVTFHSIDTCNPRRVIRAIEVIRLTGQPFSALKASWKLNLNSNESSFSENLSKLFFWVLSRDTQDLYTRIHNRVDHMFEMGLVEETKALFDKGLTENKTAMQAIGYRQVVEYIQGQRDLVSTIDLIKQKTRQFAKRQMTWFRHQLPSKWLELKPGDHLDESLEYLLIEWKMRN